MEEEEFWVVWCPQTGHPTVKHMTRQEAVAESERLARKHPGCVFYVLQAVSVSSAVRVETRPLLPAGMKNQIPLWENVGMRENVGMP